MDSLIPPSDRPTPRETRESALHTMAISAANEALRWARSHLNSTDPGKRRLVRSLVVLGHQALDAAEEVERHLRRDPTPEELQALAERVLPIRERVSEVMGKVKK